MQYFAYVIVASFITLLAMKAKGDEAPAPGSVGIKNLRYSGSGCPAGSAAVNIAPDNLAMTALFDQYLVESVSRGREIANCTLDIELEVPEGWSYGLFCVDFRGYAALDPSVQGYQSTTAKFGARERRIGRMSLRGPFNDDYQNLQQIPLQVTPFSSCGSDTLTLKTEIEVRNYSRDGQGLMTVDSIDGHLKQHYGIAWKRCRPTPRPHPGPAPGGNTITVAEIASSKLLGRGADGNDYKVENFGGACWKATKNGQPLTPCEHGFAFFLGGKFIAATQGASGKIYSLDGTKLNPGSFHSISCNGLGPDFSCEAKVGAQKTNFTLHY